MCLTRWVALSISLGLGVASVDRAMGATVGSKVWIGRHAEYEAFLRTAVVERTTLMGTTRRVFFKAGGLAASGALKRDHYTLEIAGYELDRLLELDMVPPTVEVRYEGEARSLQLWVENVGLLRELRGQHVHAPDPGKWNHQLNRAHAFEDLVANLDEREGSPVVDPEWNLIVLDHSRAFTNTLTLPYPVGTKLNQIDRVFFDRLKALDKAAVKRSVGHIVDASAIDALIARRDSIVEALERLATQKGSNHVFVP